MRIKPKLKSSFSQEKQCIKVTEFKYQQGLKNSRRKQQLQRNSTNDSPLKILLQKMSMASETNSNAKSKSNKQQSNKFTEDLIQHIVADYKKFIVPRDALYEPNRSVFNRFNYQNYNNYSYKNPFKPKKYPIDDKMEHPLKSNPHIGSNKNLQIVFCERKYKDFVQKTNTQLKQLAQTARNFPVQKVSSHKKVQSHMSRYQSEPKIPSKTMYNTRKRTTTLSNYLQQFATLQKLSDYMQRQHKINERFLLHAAYDKSRTVLLDILVHRFQFLKKMKKKCRDNIFTTIFGPQSSDPLFKIHIQEYIKFIQVFISRDADPSFVALFMFKFLFKDESSINEQAVLKSLDLIGNSANKHSVVESKIFAIMQQNMNRSDKIFQEFRTDQNLQNLFIDLIVQ